MKIQKCRVEFDINKRKFPQIDAERKDDGPFYGALPTNYTDILVRVTARTNQEAGYIAIDELDTLRGLWNSYLNPSWRILAGRRQPYNVVRTGPLHILHHPNRKLVNDQYWYEEHYVDPGSVVNLSRPSAQMRKQTLQDLRRVGATQLGPDTTEGLIRYARALDSHDWDASFLELWSVLEYLTNTTRNYDQTVKRIAFMFRDHGTTLQIAKHLRDRRNRTAHLGHSHQDIEALLVQLHSFVQVLLGFYVANPYRLASRAEMAEFLDLPKERQAMKKRIQLLKAGIRYRS